MSVVRVCIGSLHPSNDYSFHAMRKLQAIEARRGEETIERGSNNSDPLFPRPLWISRRNFDGQRVEIRSESWLRLRPNLSSNRTYFAIRIFHLWECFGEFLTIKEEWVVDCLNGSWKGDDDRWINSKEVIFPWKNYIIPFPRIRDLDDFYFNFSRAQSG